MKAAVIVFPGSNCDRDLAVALRAAGFDVAMVWHKETGLPEGIDLVGLPGGFSFGDYLRCGAIAARSPIVRAVADHAERGGYVLGICNGFQILAETGLLPGALMRNRDLKYICRTVPLIVQNADTDFTSRLFRQAAHRHSDRASRRQLFGQPRSTCAVAGRGQGRFYLCRQPQRVAERYCGGAER